MGSTRMAAWFPGTSFPLVVSAPMEGVTNARLATEVTKAGGLGFIQGGRAFDPGNARLEQLDADLRYARKALSHGNGTDSGGPLPVGVGFVTFAESVRHFATTTTPILRRHKPAAVWLFAPAVAAADDETTTATANTTIADICGSLRAASAAEPGWGSLRIVVQVGSVLAAREAASAGADVVVAQGIDAGGHQWAVGAGVVSLVPEVVDMLADEFPGREVGVWAAGGIADGRGVAACLALGAEAAVVGTRYSVADESDANEHKKAAILETVDGGRNTVKAYIHDHVQGNHTWPDVYDGRAIVTDTYRDHLASVHLEENLRRYEDCKARGDHSRVVTWSGTAVGLIKKAQPAAEITREVRDGALRELERLRGRL